MPPNKNVGYGRALFDAYPPRHIGGRVLVVGATTVSGLVTTGRLYTPDTFGKLRYFTTLAAAVAAAEANRDTIYVMAGHTETISSSTALSLSVAGMQIIGLGTGSLRPTFTLDTATTATINVTAANITVTNVLFVANFAAIASCFTLTTAKDFNCDGCEFRDTDSTHNFVAIVTTATTANAADGLRFVNNRVLGTGTTAATTPLKGLGVQDRWQINDNFISLAVLNNTSAVLAQATGKAFTNLQMARNRVIRPNTDTATGGILVTADTASTGMIHDNYVAHLDVAAAILATASTGYGFMNNLADGDADASGFVLPAIGVN